MRPTTAIVNLGRLEHNIRSLRALTSPETAFMAIVKANAYGHGAEKTARCAIESGASWLGVALPEEGAELREKGIAVPILVLGEIDEEQCGTVLEYGLTQAVPSMETANCLNQAAISVGKKASIHLKLDTGMGRIGFRSLEGLKKAARELKEMEGLSVDGAFTHFASADETDPEYTREQIKKFNSMIQILKESGFQPYVLHASNSAGILRFPEANYSLVRGGISIYGYYPSTDSSLSDSVPLLPVLQWETKIVHIKNVEAGSSISYGRTYTASVERRIATIPVGYADGYNRLLSNRADVLIRGRRAPVIGRICMDQALVDISGIPEASLGDSVVLLGEQGRETISADELADLCGTISYEILTSISERVPRVYTQAEQEAKNG
jgi:alanine racemase